MPGRKLSRITKVHEERRTMAAEVDIAPPRVVLSNQPRRRTQGPLARVRGADSGGSDSNCWRALAGFRHPCPSANAAENHSPGSLCSEEPGEIQGKSKNTWKKRIYWDRIGSPCLETKAKMALLVPQTSYDQWHAINSAHTSDTPVRRQRRRCQAAESTFLSPSFRDI
jgi:hypothetical protein